MSSWDSAEASDEEAEGAMGRGGICGVCVGEGRGEEG